MIWSCARGDKHEDIVRSTYSLVSDLSLFLDLQFLELFFMKIQGIKEHDFDEKTVAFLKQQTLNVYDNIDKRKE